MKENVKLNLAYQLTENKLLEKNLFIKSDILLKNYNLNTLMDYKLFNTLIFLITNKEHYSYTSFVMEENIEYYKISLKYSELRKFLQFNKNKGFYSFIKKSIFNLSQPIKIETETKTIITSLLWKTEFDKYDNNLYPEEYNNISFLINRKMLDEFIFDNGTFTLLNIEILNSFQSIYAMKFYELLTKQNRLENFQYLKIDLEEFNKIFKTKYKYITHTRNIINNAINHINERVNDLNIIKNVFITNNLIKKINKYNGNNIQEHISIILKGYEKQKYKQPINYLKLEDI